MKDYYYILGIETNATIEEIKYSHRSLSKKFHPDINPSDRHSEKMFKDIQEAYECLSNTEKRKGYDYNYQNWLKGNNTQHASNEIIDFEKPKKLIKKVQSWYFIIAPLVVMIVSLLIYINKEYTDYINYVIAPALAIGLYVYFLPTIISFSVAHSFRKEIFVINIFCFIPAIFPFGWLLLLIFSFNRVNAISTLFLAILGIFAQNQFNRNNQG